MVLGLEGKTTPEMLSDGTRLKLDSYPCGQKVFCM